jgi:hypothetical protein
MPRHYVARETSTLLETRGLVREISPPITSLNSVVIEPSCSIWDTNMGIDEFTN